MFQPHPLYVTRFPKIDKFRDDLLEKDIFLSFDTILSLFEEWLQDEATKIELVGLSGRNTVVEGFFNVK